MEGPGRSPVDRARPAQARRRDGGPFTRPGTLGRVTGPRAWLEVRVRLARRGLVLAGRAVSSALAPVGRRAPEIVVTVGLVLSVLGALVLVGASRNDASIEAARGETVGEVLDGSSLQRTFVRFTAADGAVLTPEDGVFYPRGLEPGDLVRVEYDTTDPELVRVAGRTWREGLVPVVLGVVGLWVVLGPGAYGLARLRRRRAARPEEPLAPTAPEREPVGVGR